MLSRTYTYVDLELSPAAYGEIEAKLRASGYDHAFDRDGRIDLHGLAAVKGPATPSAKWCLDGQDDPFGERYNCARDDLMLGSFTDDEIANEVYLRGNMPLTHAELLAGRPGPIVYLTAAKDRIRWLSRQLEKALKDAARYRWLREYRTFTTLVNADSSNRNYDPDGNGNEELLDKVIDKMIAKESGNG